MYSGDATGEHTEEPRNAHEEINKSAEKPSRIQDELIEYRNSHIWANERIRSTQNAIIKQLPENFVEQMHAHLMAVDIQQERYGGKHTESREDQLKILTGEIFERLIYIEIVRPLEITDPTKIAERQLANEAQALFNDRKRFNLKGGGRNPDAAILDIETQKIVAVIEDKLGPFDERAYKQAVGYKRSLEEALNEVKNTRAGYETSEEFKRVHGISEEITQLEIAEDMKRIFVVPRNRDITNPASLIRKEYKDGTPAFTNESDRLDFERQIKEGDIKVIKSVFSNDDIGALAEALMTKIETRYNQ